MLRLRFLDKKAFYINCSTHIVESENTITARHIERSERYKGRKKLELA